MWLANNKLPSPASLHSLWRNHQTLSGQSPTIKNKCWSLNKKKIKYKMKPLIAIWIIHHYNYIGLRLFKNIKMFQTHLNQFVLLKDPRSPIHSIYQFKFMINSIIYSTFVSLNLRYNSTFVFFFINIKIKSFS